MFGGEVELHSDLTCPACGFVERLSMPTDACVFFHECTRCNTRLRPLQGDCCVFCSYGSMPCPPIQAGRTDCCTPNVPDIVAAPNNNS
ncbi:MAG: GDCCVxC domain-containing (seleno)protein [Gemmatimonadaceae bacterium]